MLGLLTTACFGGGDTYDLNAISDAKVSVGADGRRVLSFRVRQDSVYACAGACARKKKDDGDHFTVVRCAIGKECSVDLPASAAATGETHTVTLPVDTAPTVHLSEKTGSQAVPIE